MKGGTDRRREALPGAAPGTPAAVRRPPSSFGAPAGRAVGRAAAGRTVPRGPALGVLALLACVALVLPAAADTIEGVVRGPDGAPAGNVDFDVFDTAGNKLPDEANSDPDGTYALNLLPGVYDIEAQPPIASGLAPQVRRGVRVAGDAFLDWTLAPSARVLGRVRGPGGAPVPGVRIQFDRAADGTRQPALGNETGPFGTCAAYLEPGTYVVTAMPPEASGLAPARIEARAIAAGDTLSFVLVPASRVAARVLGPTGEAVAGARLRFERPADGARMPAWGVETGAEGRCVAGVAPGAYRLSVVPPPGVRLAGTRAGTLDASGDTAVEVVLPAGFAVTGQVLDPGGRPVAGGDWDAADEASGDGVPLADDGTDADGRFTLWLPAGTFRLDFDPPAGSGLGPLVLDGVVVAGDRAVEADYGGGAAVPVSVALAPRATPAHGRAEFVLTLAAPAAVRVEVFDAHGRRVRTLAAGDRARGTFAVPWDGRDASGARVGAGVYFARAVAPGASAGARVVLLP